MTLLLLSLSILTNNIFIFIIFFNIIKVYTFSFNSISNCLGIYTIFRPFGLLLSINSFTLVKWESLPCILRKLPVTCGFLSQPTSNFTILCVIKKKKKSIYKKKRSCDDNSNVCVLLLDAENNYARAHYGK